MKIRNVKTNNKILLIPLAVLALLLIGFGTVYAVSGSFFGWEPLNNSSQESPSDEQLENGQNIKNDSLENKNGQSGSDQPVVPRPDTTGKSKIEIDIVSVNRVDENIKVSTLISALDQSGTCALTVTDSNGSTLYSANVDVQAMSNTSTCKGFDIPATNIQDGNYKITINYTSPTLYGSATYESK